ncbi:hypothetical protein RM531_08295 [Salinisphaera sp. P385]|uniref:Uncharacterized protein n=1 Tax=Spectribacter acetivorans TaxID=3075603 RepID=A0ABU3B7N0_9GAMM|nr:hypothetical protein [Salinisphaera sp. P385]MDT0618475.1 hypothetical protein [Salinisphaera sp. P385]
MSFKSSLWVIGAASVVFTVCSVILLSTGYRGFGEIAEVLGLSWSDTRWMLNTYHKSAYWMMGFGVGAGLIGLVFLGMDKVRPGDGNVVCVVSATSLLSSLVLFLAVCAWFAGSSGLMLKLSMTHEIEVDGNRVVLSGAVPPDLEERMRKAIQGASGVSILELAANEGGALNYLESTRDYLVGEGVRRAVVTGPCGSACALLALMMPEAYVANRGRLGFHQTSSGTKLREQNTELRESLIRAIDRQRGNGELVSALSVGEPIVYQPRGFLLDRGLIDGCWDEKAGEPARCRDIPEGPFGLAEGGLQ